MIYVFDINALKLKQNEFYTKIVSSMIAFKKMKFHIRTFIKSFQLSNKCDHYFQIKIVCSYVAVKKS